MKQEIERKWRLNRLPALASCADPVRIRQGYLMTDEGELRIRAKNDECFLTVKGEGDLSRNEWETPIPDWVFQLLWPKTDGRALEKIRYSLDCGDLTLEFDVYLGRLKDLVILEIEFPDKAAAQAFEIKYLQFATNTEAEEVTYDQNFKNKNLANWLSVQNITTKEE